MVGPAAQREAVAHLRMAFEMSERQATTLVGADRATIRYRSRRRSAIDRGDRTMRRCAHGSAISRISAIASVTGACSSCCDARARSPASTRSTGCTGPKVSRCASVRDGDAPSGCGRRWP